MVKKVEQGKAVGIGGDDARNNQEPGENGYDDVNQQGNDDV